MVVYGEEHPSEETKKSSGTNGWPVTSTVWTASGASPVFVSTRFCPSECCSQATDPKSIDVALSETAGAAAKTGGYGIAAANTKPATATSISRRHLLDCLLQ